MLTIHCLLILSVKDTGSGIKAEYINKLFTKFERLDVERNTTTEGTGLGLAITKALVEMMGGKINVQSKFGQGSLFVVQIPQKINHMSTSAEEQPINHYRIEQETSVKTLAGEASSTDKNRRILIVDDSKLNIKIARKVLNACNFYDVEECYNGQQCLDKINSDNQYDLILMDIMMPEMSGEVALTKLKENSRFKTPVIALTADAVAGAKEKYMAEGFTDYLAKPFTKDQLREKINFIFYNNHCER